MVSISLEKIIGVDLLENIPNIKLSRQIDLIVNGWIERGRQMNENVFIYRIDNRDIIVSVSRSWEVFARANAWGSELSPENVVGHLLWDFIHDIET